jgi:hypothetical protein
VVLVLWMGFTGSCLCGDTCFGFGDRLQLAGELVAVFGGPGQAFAVGCGGDSPSTVGFGAVVAATQRSHIRLVGWSRWEWDPVIQIAGVGGASTSRADTSRVTGAKMVPQRRRRPILAATHIHGVPDRWVGEHSLPGRVFLRGEMQGALCGQPPVTGQMPRLSIHPQRGRRRQCQPHVDLGVLEVLTRQTIQRHIGGDLIQRPVITRDLQLSGYRFQAVVSEMGAFPIALNLQQPATIVQDVVAHSPCRSLRLCPRLRRIGVDADHRASESVVELPGIPLMRLRDEGLFDLGGVFVGQHLRARYSSIIPSDNASRVRGSRVVNTCASSMRARANCSLTPDTAVTTRCVNSPSPSASSAAARSAKNTNCFAASTAHTRSEAR